MTPAHITRTPVRPVRVALVCECGGECEYAIMLDVLEAKTCNPVGRSFEHYCPSCGARHEADRRHPYIDYEPEQGREGGQ